MVHLHRKEAVPDWKRVLRKNDYYRKRERGQELVSTSPRTRETRVINACVTRATIDCDVCRADEKGLCDERAVSPFARTLRNYYLALRRFVAGARGCVPAHEVTSANFSTFSPSLPLPLALAGMLNCNESVREFSNFCL